MRSTVLLLSLLLPLQALALDASEKTGDAARAGGDEHAPGSRGQKRYSGRRVDLDFRQADLRNVLGVLARAGEVELVLADDVHGEITIKMRNVPWEQALEIIARQRALTYEREGKKLLIKGTAR